MEKKTVAPAQIPKTGSTDHPAKSTRSDDETNVAQTTIDDGVTCWKCKVIGKPNRGLKIHLNACLQKPAKGTSFFQDERIELNRENRDRKRQGMKILPQ